MEYVVIACFHTRKIFENPLKPFFEKSQMHTSHQRYISEVKISRSEWRFYSLQITIDNSEGKGRGRCK